MELDRDTKNIVIGAVMSGAVVGTAWLCTKQWGRSSPLDNLSKTIGQIGDAMDNLKKEGKPVVREAEQFLHKRESALSEIVGLVAEGMKLWQKIRN